MFENDTSDRCASVEWQEESVKYSQGGQILKHHSTLRIFEIMKMVPTVHSKAHRFAEKND